MMKALLLLLNFAVDDLSTCCAESSPSSGTSPSSRSEPAFVIPPGNPVDISFGLGVQDSAEALPAIRAFRAHLALSATYTIPGPYTGLFLRGTVALELINVGGYANDQSFDLVIEGHRAQAEAGARWPFWRLFDFQLGGYAGFRQRGPSWSLRTGGVARLQMMRSARHKNRLGVFVNLDLGSYWEPSPNTYPTDRGRDRGTDPTFALYDGSLTFGLVYQFRP